MIFSRSEVMVLRGAKRWCFEERSNGASRSEAMVSRRVYNSLHSPLMVSRSFARLPQSVLVRRRVDVLTLFIALLVQVAALRSYLLRFTGVSHKVSDSTLLSDLRTVLDPSTPMSEATPRLIAFLSSYGVARTFPKSHHSNFPKVVVHVRSLDLADLPVNLVESLTECFKVCFGRRNVCAASKVRKRERERERERESVCTCTCLCICVCV